VGFLLLGTDSLIACIAVGSIISRRIAIPLAILFGVGDGGGYLLGTAFHWSVSDSFSTFVTTSVLVILGVYWLAVAAYSRWATAKDPDSTRARWAVWILPWALSIDNITYGLVDGGPGTPRSGSRRASRRCPARCRPASGFSSPGGSSPCSRC
jgi:hypothetical protein